MSTHRSIPVLLIKALLCGSFLSVVAMGQIAFRREVNIGSHHFSHFAANSTTFVWAGKAGLIATSTDGLNWLNQDAGTYESFNKLFVIGERFVAGGEAGSVFTSENGKTWQQRLVGVTQLNQGETDGVLYAERPGFAATLLKSVDGLTWTEVTETPSYSHAPAHQAQLGDITLDGWSRSTGNGESADFTGSINQLPSWSLANGHPESGSLAFGNDVWISNGGYFSNDGIHWEPMSIIDTLSRRPFGAVSIAGERFFFFDNNPHSQIANELWTWNEGAEFQLATTFEAPVEPEAAYTNGVYLFLEHESTAIYRSRDALTWTRIPDALSPGNLGYHLEADVRSRTVVSSDHGFLLLLGGIGFFTSPDGLAWSPLATDLDGIASPTQMKHSGGLLVVHDGNQIWTSPNATHWEVVTDAPLSRIDHAVYSGSHLLVVGLDEATSGLRYLAARDDGGHWTRAVLATNERARDLVTGNGLTLAGFESDIWSARDGVGPRITIAGDTHFEVFADHTLSLAATVESARTYETQWARGSLNVPNATSTRLSWSFDVPTDGQEIPFVLKVNDGSHLTSAVFYVTVHSNTPPTFGATDLVASIRPNASGGLDQTLWVAAVGPQLHYQWFRNGMAIVHDRDHLNVPINVSTLGDVYHVVVSNPAGSITSEEHIIRKPALTASAPELWRGPGPEVFQVNAQGAWGYQWRHNGIPIPGANRPQLAPTSIISGVYEPFAPGFYDVLIFNAETTIRRGPIRYPADGGEPLPGDIPDYPWAPLTPVHLSNLSVRAEAGSGAAALVPGFVISGEGIVETSNSASLLLRAIGPGLIPYGIENAMDDPRLQLRDPTDELIAQNFRWGDATGDLASVFETVGAFALDPASKDAALVHVIPHRIESTILTANAANTDGTTGETLVELYLVPDGNGSHLTNLSTRGVIKPDRPLTAGFVVEGTGSLNLLMRAVGPSLRNFGVEDVAISPRLSLFDGNGELIVESPPVYPHNLANIEQAVGAFPINASSADTAIVKTLDEGVYTLRAEDDLEGIVLVEIYLIPRDTFLAETPSP
ncbi:sialidase family protein [Synoicihabitans lomoniglobus]|uniref:Photosynthesis system II assembly factor Ycf48/Hcf136-like domain-containing protein n=1 Tax=Synoicihabitans lomoniglobus TaxID=2909285 RepID=A0AAF0I2Q9_9BACT|nr:hypothetical protein [Opitutaceae bacterium LMO-M01]WED65893.1 hypothetical protein PXH66_03400 [Opitutaceae bacterium LMO-M01]